MRVKNSYKTTSRLKKFLRSGKVKVKFEKLRGIRTGEYEEGMSGIILYIDPRKDILPTLIHEVLHCWYPTWSEDRVYKEESRILKSLSCSQAKHILKVLMEIV